MSAKLNPVGLAAGKIAKPLSAKSNILFKLDSPDPIAPRFGLYWKNVLLAGFSDSHVQLVKRSGGKLT